MFSPSAPSRAARCRQNPSRPSRFCRPARPFRAEYPPARDASWSAKSAPASLDSPRRPKPIPPSARKGARRRSTRQTGSGPVHRRRSWGFFHPSCSSPSRPPAAGADRNILFATQKHQCFGVTSILQKMNQLWMQRSPSGLEKPVQPIHLEHHGLGISCLYTVQERSKGIFYLSLHGGYEEMPEMLLRCLSTIAISDHRSHRDLYPHHNRAELSESSPKGVALRRPVPDGRPPVCAFRQS